MESIDSYKLVEGSVGSGKTWLAVAYMMHKYGEELKCSLGDPPKMYGVVIVPPTCVAQWSDFFLKYTDIPVISGYESSCFFVKNWEKELTNYGVCICSNLTSGKIVSSLLLTKKPILMLHDEAHNAIKADYQYAIEVIGFTASINTFHRRQKGLNIDWKVFKLSSQTLSSSLADMEFISYEIAGVRPVDAWHMVRCMSNNDNFIMMDNMDLLDIYATFGTPKFQAFVKIGKKFIGNKWYRDEQNNEEIQAKLISLFLAVPKMRQLLAVANLVKSKGEKLIIFDVNQNYIIDMTIFLQHCGFKVFPFCTDFNPKGRVKILKEFQEKGDILIGSIQMLSESHNITEANHIVFVRYPSTAEEFDQAFGRCHRYPQKKTVFIHLIFATELEKFSAFQALDDRKKPIKISEHLKELNYLRAEALKHQSIPANNVLNIWSEVFY